jgi:hypothetical protein
MERALEDELGAALACLARGPEGIDTFVAQAPRMFAGDRNLSHAQALAECVAGVSDRLPQGVPLQEQDRPFWALMAKAMQRRAAAGGCDPGVDDVPPILEVGPEFDFLSERCYLESLSLVQFCCVALQSRRPARHRLAVVLVARDEGIYLPEWIAHYRLLGVDRIFVYSNDNGDGSDGLLEALARAGAITLLRNVLKRRTNPQTKAYQHAILLLNALRDYRWVAFVDADEFVFFRDGRPGQLARFIDEVEGRGESGRIAAVFLPWRWRLTDRALHRDAIAVLPDYDFCVDSTQGKSIVRLSAVTRMCSVHYPDIAQGRVAVDGMLREMAWATMREGVARPYEGPTVEHFWSKSFVEYLPKLHRSEMLTQHDPQLRRGLENFFVWTAPLLPAYYTPLDRAWIGLVAAETEAILRQPEVASAYAAVVAGYRAAVDEILRDATMMAIYQDMLKHLQPGLR